MKRRRLYLDASEYTQKLLEDPSLINEDGIHCPMCSKKLKKTFNRKRFCSSNCYQLYVNIKRSKHHHYETCSSTMYRVNHKEFLLTLTEINLSGELWEI